MRQWFHLTLHTYLAVSYNPSHIKISHPQTPRRKSGPLDKLYTHSCVHEHEARRPPHSSIRLSRRERRHNFHSDDRAWPTALMSEHNGLFERWVPQTALWPVHLYQAEHRRTLFQRKQYERSENKMRAQANKRENSRYGSWYLLFWTLCP